METVSFIAVRFSITLAWVGFASWAISRFAFADEPPARRAALTALNGAGAAFGGALLLTLVIPEFTPPPLYLPRYDLEDFAIATALYLPAVFVDFLLLRAAYPMARRGEEEIAGTFD